MAEPQIRELSELADFEAVARLFDEIWRPGPDVSLASADLQRALTKAGNYVAGAYDGDGRLLGAAVAFFGPPAQRMLHSHIAGVVTAARGVGFALKLHQRHWALERGVTSIEWTYDPLVSRNAYFNVVKLGATPVEYLPNFYGRMQDGINAGDESDRLLVHWDLTAPVGGPVADPAGAVVGLGRSADGSPVSGSAGAVVGLGRSADGSPVSGSAGAVVGLGRSADGSPVPGSTDGETVLVAVPSDVEKLRAADPAAARRWRTAVRDVLAPLLAEGARVTGFDRDGGYVLTRKAVR